MEDFSPEKSNQPRKKKGKNANLTLKQWNKEEFDGQKADYGKLS